MLRSFVRLLTGLGKSFVPPADRKRLRTVLGVTPLEDRTVPAAIPVIGPNGGAWVKIDTLTVATKTNQSVSTGVTSNVALDYGVTYLAVASGTARIATDATGFADAEFIRYNKSTGPQDGSSPGFAWNNHGVRLAGLDGGTTTGNLWGGYQADHQYVREFVGQGTKVTGYYSDIPGYYGDNSGTLQVDIYAEVATVIAKRIADAVEGGAGGMFQLTRTGDLSQSLTVNYAVDGSAAPGSDYEALSGSGTFQPGQNYAQVRVIAHDDGEPEATETVAISLLSGARYVPESTSLVTCELADNDNPAANPNYVVTTSADAGAGSLRDAIIKANEDDSPGVKVIVFDTTKVTGPIVLKSQLPAIAKQVYIAWTGGGRLTIQRDTSTAEAQAKKFRLFDVTKDGSLILGNLTLLDGLTGADGGAVRSFGALTLSGCEVRNNYAGAQGGAVACEVGFLEIYDSQVNGNNSEFWGGESPSALR